MWVQPQPLNIGREKVILNTAEHPQPVLVWIDLEFQSEAGDCQ